MKGRKKNVFFFLDIGWKKEEFREGETEKARNYNTKYVMF